MAVAQYKALVTSVEELLSDVAARQYWLVDHVGASTVEEWTLIQEATVMAAKNGSVLRSWGKDDTWAKTEGDLALYESNRLLQTEMRGGPPVSLNELYRSSPRASPPRLRHASAAALRGRATTRTSCPILVKCAIENCRRPACYLRCYCTGT